MPAVRSPRMAPATRRGLLFAVLLFAVLLALPGPAAQVHAQEVRLVSNDGGSPVGSRDVEGNAAFGQGFGTGGNPWGYTLTKVRLWKTDPDDSGATLRVCRSDASGLPIERSCTPLTPPTLNNVNNAGWFDFTAPENTVLLPNTDYVAAGSHVVGTNDNRVVLRRLGSASEQGRPGWTVADHYIFAGSTSLPTAEQWRTITDGQLWIEVYGAVNENTAPTAADGEVDTYRNETYTFSVSDFGFSDADGEGLSSVTIVTLSRLERGYADPERRGHLRGCFGDPGGDRRR